jgi:hypothetical protein
MAWKHLFVAAAALTVVVGAPARAQSTDPMLGTWKLNVAKSKTPYKSGTTVIEAVGDAVKVTADLAAADGTAYHWTWTAKYGGPDAPVTGTTPYGPGAVASITRVDPHTTKVVGKKDGKVILTQTIVVAADGKTRTVTSKGTDAKGQPIDTVSVYDRQ